MMTFSATYSPDDNKLRLYASQRLDPATYARVKAAGFGWAPKQELFVAPAWTPSREDLALELAGEIGDDDSSLTERAEERAERFGDYQEKRAEDAERARVAVAVLADNIPLGQPILVGHHSEKHARRDADRIETGIRRAVKLWQTSEYWKDRARGAIRHAKYKERADVRARRIKGLEADERKQQRAKTDAENAAKLWGRLHEAGSLTKKDGQASTFYERALYVSGHTNTAPFGVYSDLLDNKITPEQAQARAVEAARGVIAYAERWLAHLANRLTYERAMLADVGGTAADKVGPEKGGACRCWASPRGGWSYIVKVNKVSVTVLDNWGNGGENFTRTMPFDKLCGVMTAAEVQAARDDGRLIETEDKTGFGLLSAPKQASVGTSQEKPTVGNAADFAALAASLKAGVQVVTAPQLFPTPADVAARMVALAEIEPGHRVLEPSAGTGALVEAMPKGTRLALVEVNMALADRLATKFQGTPVYPGDFLERTGWELGAPFDRIVMNPPFANASDVKHIEHARGMLAPGGKLVAICANGPRQADALQAHADSWEELPAGTFNGTDVRAVLLTMTAAE